MPPKSVNFVPETAENGWRHFAHPHEFSHGQTLPALPHGHYMAYNRQQANFGTCHAVARAYSLEQPSLYAQGRVKTKTKKKNTHGIKN